MAQLRALQPGLPIAVRTMAPEWVFASAGIPVQYVPAEIDSAVVEHGMLHQDIGATLARAQRIEVERETIIAREVAVVREAGIALIVSDIPPLASDIGEAAGIPTVAIGNFSWDYIYQPFIAADPGFAPLVENVRCSYSRTSLLLRLPFHHAMDAFPRQEDIPLITRSPSSLPDEILRRLGLDLRAREKRLLVALRQQEVPRGALDGLAHLPGLRVISLNQVPPGTPPDIIALDSSWSGRFCDLVSACDIVVSKLGYGIVSECVALRTAIVYPPRCDWAEQPLLTQGMEPLIPAAAMPESDFLSGKWAPYVQDLMAAPMPGVEIDASGAEVAARYLLSSL